MDMYSFTTYNLNPTCTNILLAHTPSEHYWNSSAQLREAAWLLIVKLDINFPRLLQDKYSPFSPFIKFARTVMHPLYHLVITGKDTDANIGLLLGPTWKKDGSQRSHLICRLLVLMDPEKGSVPYRAAQIFRNTAVPTMGIIRGKNTTNTGAGKRWNPRSASEAEGVLLRRIKWENSKIGFVMAPAPAVKFHPQKSRLDVLREYKRWRMMMLKKAGVVP